MGLWVLALVLSILTTKGFAGSQGLPITRIYPFEEIGHASRGGRLGFDSFGRVAVVQDGSFVVLNDRSWVDIAERGARIHLLQARAAEDGSSYYGALGSCGRLVTRPDGSLGPESVLPADCPRWVLSTNFTDIQFVKGLVCFSGWNGVVLFDPHTKVCRFVEITELAAMFELGGRVYAASNVDRMLELDLQQARVLPAQPTLFGDSVVNQRAFFGNGDALLVSTGRRLYLAHGGTVQPFPGPLQRLVVGQVTAVQGLPEGDVAVAISNAGLFIVGADGTLRLSLTGAEFGRIGGLATRERGVLWAISEAAVLRVLYNHPVSVFGQALGISVNWPQPVLWDGKVVMASGGHIYESLVSDNGVSTRFQLMPGQPAPAHWGIATWDDWLLITAPFVVCARRAGGEFQQVLSNLDPGRIAMSSSGVCFVLCREEIAAITLRDGQWVECAPRVKGLGFAALVHAGRNSAWVELGVNRAARITLKEGRIETRIFEEFPWKESSWVNISVLGDLVFLTGPDGRHVFFDELTEQFREAPEVEAVLAACPYPVARLAVDKQGSFWASCAHGLVSLVPEGGRYRVDALNYDLIYEGVPMVHVLPDGDLWVSTGDSLYHLSPLRTQASPAGNNRPLLTAIRDTRTDQLLLHGDRVELGQLTFPYAQNSLRFEFFAGSYHTRRPPDYEYRLSDGEWRPANDVSAVTLSDLLEGFYRLEVRLADLRGASNGVTALEFRVAPPWYRTWYAMFSYPMLAIGIIALAMRISVRHAVAKNQALARQVEIRTHELRAAMDKLKEETQVSATLAERNRLAGEIHDSLEQGFTGIQLQLETIATLPDCPERLREPLGVALSMVAYSRNEVRHAVRNLHSPFLDCADLGTALRRMVAQLAPQRGFASVRVEGTEGRLPPNVEHHLLRIAQEAVANTLKHAGATLLELRLVYGSGELLLEIRDNGSGFDPAAALAEEAGHFGLPSFRGRAAAIGGAVEILSRPGQGTLIRVRIVQPPVV